MTNFTSLIAGSTGYLGSKILNYLSKEDEKIYSLSRRKNTLNNANLEQAKLDKVPIYWMERAINFVLLHSLLKLNLQVIIMRMMRHAMYPF